MVRVGGITPWLEIAALARAWDVPLAPHFMMELSGQLLCCLPHGHILENIDGGSLTDLGALAEPIRIEDGHFTPPDRPGHGIVFDRTALAAHAVDTLTISIARGRSFLRRWAKARRRRLGEAAASVRRQFVAWIEKI